MSRPVKFHLWTTALLCLAILAPLPLAARSQHHAKKKEEPPPLPHGPQGPVPQVPLDSIPPVPPTVTYHDGQLMILAPNCTLADVLRLVRKETGADMDIPPAANERIVTTLGPGPAQEVVSDLLNGSHFNYILLGSPTHPKELTRVILVPKSGSEPAPTALAQSQQAAPPPPIQPGPQTPQPDTSSNDDADSQFDQNAPEENQEQPAEADQQNPNEPPGVKTPQQMLQEMQARQMQMQQQGNGGQPVPGAPVPPPPQQ